MPMSWRCPACRAIIQHSERDETPSVRERYRCIACRLDLKFDNQTQRLTGAVMDAAVVSPEHASSSSRADRPVRVRARVRLQRWPCS
jgi:hypothetical protein